LQLTFRSNASSSSAYRADIDGLRAIAVVSVLLFHARVPGFSGGFVGVDIFFVISGYLITNIVHRDLLEDRFTFLGFYERRIRRIFPTLFTVLVVCTAVGMVLFPPQQLVEFARSLLAVLGFVSNIYFQTTSRTQGYFTDHAAQQYLLHTWSLSVEEQFYLLFPCLLLCLHKFARPYKRAALLVLAVLSFLLSVRGVRQSPISAFYLLPGRAWELLAGSLLALKPLPALTNSLARGLLGLAGLGAIVYAIGTFTDGTPFPGAAALVPCGGAALLLYAGEGGDSFTRIAMGFRPLVFIGAISYSLYLWHWPLIVWTKYFYTTYWLPPEREIPGLVLSFVLAFLTFEFIETPFRTRRSKVDRQRRHPAVWAGVGASALLAAMALGLIVTHGFPTRFSAHKTAQMAENYARKSEFPEVGKCNNYKTNMQRYEDVVFCELGQPARKNILFLGDSHLIQLYPLLKDMQQQDQFHGRSAVLASGGGCPPSEGVNNAFPGYDCDSFTRFALQRASMDDIDTVFVVFSPWWALSDGNSCIMRDGHCVQSLTGDQAWHLVMNEMDGHIRDLRKMGKRVILTVPFPIYDKFIPDMEIRNIGLAPFRIAALEPIQLIPDTLRHDVRDLAARAGADLYDPNETLCKGGKCIYAVDGISLYVDHIHLAPSSLEPLRPGLRTVFDQPGSPHAAGQTVLP
jgi:peptidoglycan/LPS O-acetylase OafA/YrhL